MLYYSLDQNGGTVTDYNTPDIFELLLCVG